MTHPDFSDSLWKVMIDFTRAFDSAWERMMVILFRPFDLGKWFVIGFSAFLAGLLQGGNGFNGSFNNGWNNQNWNRTDAANTPKFDWPEIHSRLTNALVGLQVGMIVILALVFIVVIFAVALAMYWLGARGQFLFLDNLVRNRGAVSWPWTHYARQANSLFLFYLLFLLISLVVFLPILVVAVIMAIPLFQQQRWPVGGEIVGFVVLGLVYFILAVILGFVIFIFREFGVPIMFRNGLLARAAFLESMGLLRTHPGSVAVFVLLRFAIAIAVAVISIIVCCLTCCCCETLPYIGTVLLLPVLVFVRCFSLDCLAQFGPQYDVFTVDLPPPGPVGTPAFSLPPPPG